MSWARQTGGIFGEARRRAAGGRDWFCAFSLPRFSASFGDEMLAKIYSAAVYGIDAYEVEIEVNAGRGEPKIIIVGLPDTAVKESQDQCDDCDQQ